MKKELKILGLFIFVFSLSSCNSNDDLKYTPNEESGWIQFIEGSASQVGAFQGAENDLELAVNIQVPTTNSDLTIFYDMEVVSGENPTTYFSNNGKLVAPAGSTSHGGPDNGTGIEYNYLANIVFDLEELSGVQLSEPMVFDVVLSSTSSSDITAGLAGVSEYPVTKRVIIYPSLDVFVGTYSVSEQFTAGVNAPNGLGDFFGESYQVELSRVSGDDSASKFVITNSDGFNPYFVDNTILTFGFDGSLSFDDGNSEDGFPFVADFRLFEFETSSYNYDLTELIAAGPLDTFGAYQFVLTKQ